MQDECYIGNMRTTRYWKILLIYPMINVQNSKIAMTMIDSRSKKSHGVSNASGKKARSDKIRVS